MCFSPEADLVAGVIIGGIAVDTLRQVEHRRDIPLAALPMVFAVHQVTESFVWWGLLGEISESISDRATWLYLVIAFCIVPILVPSAVTLHEERRHRRSMYGFVALGAIVAGLLTYALQRGPITAEIHNHHIEYSVDLAYGGAIVLAYIIATCGALFISQTSLIRWFGLANLIAAGALIWIDKSAFISLWCLWAALTSIAINLLLRSEAGARSHQLRPV